MSDLAHAPAIKLASAGQDNGSRRDWPAISDLAFEFVRHNVLYYMTRVVATRALVPD
jgi:hypothetical protein